MKILLITNAVPYPPYSGARLYTYSLLRRIASRHEVSLACFQRLGQEESVAHLSQYCRDIVTAPPPRDSALDRPLDLVRYLMRGCPPDLRFYESAELRDKLGELTGSHSFDVVYIDHSEMGIYLDTLPSTLARRSIWGLHDVDWIKFSRISRLEPRWARKLRTGLHGRLMHYWKPRQAERFACCTTVSEVDRRLMRDANPRLRVEVIPAGVDIEWNSYLPEDSATRPSLIFVGTMGYRPNIDAVQFFVAEILPLIWLEMPEVEFWIVGRNPYPELLRLNDDRIHQTGEVADVRPYYGRSTLCVVPLRAGGGARLKILEAMALGRAVISTTIGCEGQSLVDGEHLLTADQPAVFAAQTLRLLRDHELRRTLVAKARQAMAAQYNWDLIANRLMAICAEAASCR
jgi:polysaccharide biosynthesis protein PslH